MKRFLITIISVLTLGSICAQSYQDRFDAALNAADVKAQRQVLAEWIANAPEDVDCYIARYNYYVNYVGAILDQGNADDAAMLEVQRSVDSGLAVIDEAIEHYPNRLDLRFGKIYFLGVLHSWDAFANEIVSCLDHSETIDHRWSFPNVEEGMEDLIIESMLDYQTTMFEAVEDMKHPSAGDTVMMMRIRKVAKRSVQLFPGDIYQVNILASTYTFVGEYESAVRYLQRAERIDPNDVTVLRNLRDVYGLMGKKAQAKQYNDRLMLLQQ